MVFPFWRVFEYSRLSPFALADYFRKQQKPIFVRYTVILTDEVKAKLHALPLELRREIGHKLFLLEEGDRHSRSAGVDGRGGITKRWAPTLHAA